MDTQQGTERSATVPAPYTRALISKPGPDEPPPGRQAIVAVLMKTSSPEPAGRNGGHLKTVNAMIERLGQETAGDRGVLVGGIIPAAWGLDFDSILEWAC
ncbi:hypothetical protein [Streptomyces fuscichromogenes]|uniref:Uncharacterized protein n=1 Tax=Streptomyces fuscichromogenes TaxID=1324013 RepID=A0A917XFR3_9ACTN|nr:hypothetical protein [Streptomyces fuscichromogenes]GGN20207.1 hypothetical protein GCM10011578_050560 [Streptomyces fuscichromogenes]